jgi:hypothetical protein
MPPGPAAALQIGDGTQPEAAVIFSPLAAVGAVLQVDVESEASAPTDLRPSFVAAKTRLSKRARLIPCGSA